MISLRRRLMALALLPALAFGVAACGSKDSPSNASAGTSPTASASDGTVDSTALFAQIITAAYDTSTAHITMTMTGPDGSTTLASEGDIRFAKPTPEAQLTMQLAAQGGGTLEMRMVGGSFYMSMPAVTGKGKFFKLDPSNAAFGSLSTQLENMGLDESLGNLQKSLIGMKDLGQDTIDGETLEKYEMTVDAKKALAASGQSTADVPNLPDTIVYDLWLNSDNLVRRMEFTMMGSVTTMDYTHWGEPVSIKAPKRSDLVKPPAGLG